MKKNNIFKISLILTLMIIVFSLNISTASAIEITSKLTNVAGSAGFQGDNPNIAKTVGTIVKGFLSLLGILFMGYVIYAGQLWMTARGNEEQITKAKAIIRGSIIGILIVFSAYTITNFVVKRAISATNYSASTSTADSTDD